MPRTYILQSRWRPTGLMAILILGMCISLPTPAAEESPARLVYVVREGDVVVASNVLFSRSDELKLFAQETILRQEEDNAIVVLLTNRRLVAYSVYTAGWVALDLRAGEELERLEAEDYSAFALTSRRILNFNGKNGSWSQTGR